MPTIDALTDVASLSGAERVPISQAGTAKDASVSDFAAYAKVVNSLSTGVFPERPDSAGAFFTTQGAGDPLSVWFAPTINTVAGVGPTMQSTGGLTIYTRGAIAAGPDRVYEVEAEVEQVSVGGGEAPAVRLGMTSMKADYSATDGTPDAFGSVSAAMTAGQVLVFRYRFGYAAPAGGAGWADPTTAIFLRPLVQINRKADNSGNETNSIARVRRFKVTDVTDLVATELRLSADETNLSDLQAGGETVTTLSIVAGVVTIDLGGNKRNFKVPLTANITSFVYANVPAGPKEFSWSLKFVGDGTARTVTGWPTAVKHNGGTTPTIATNNGRITRFTQVTDDGGGNIDNYKAGETR